MKTVVSGGYCCIVVFGSCVGVVGSSPLTRGTRGTEDEVVIEKVSVVRGYLHDKRRLRSYIVKELRRTVEICRRQNDLNNVSLRDDVGLKLGS